MARPITWQNVNSPQGALSIEAMLRSGRQAGEGFETMGNVFKTARDEMQQAATGAAVAQIANAQDPLAVAAAAPQSWQFDPLAISAAANAREGQLFDRTVKESDLRENELSIKNTESLLADRESMRQIATMIAPYEALARAGKDFDVDEDSSPFWKTPAGFEAKKHLEELKNTAFNQSQERSRTAAAGVQARAASEQLKLVQNRMNADDQYAAWRLTKDGSKADDAEQQRMAAQIGKATGAGEAYAQTLPSKFVGARGLATEEEKNRPTSVGGLTGNDLLSRESRKVAIAEANEAAKLATWEPYLKLGQEYDTNPFQGKDDFTSVKALRGLVEGFEGEGIIPTRYDDGDIIQRVDQIVDWSLRNKTPIDRDQAFMIVGKTIGEPTFWRDATDRIINQAVQRDIELFHDFNLKGKTAGIQVAVDQQKAQTEKVRKEAARAQAVIESALINNGDVTRSMLGPNGVTGSWDDRKGRGASGGF